MADEYWSWYRERMEKAYEQRRTDEEFQRIINGLLNTDRNILDSLNDD